MPTLQQQLQQLAAQIEQLADQVKEQPTEQLCNLDNLLLQAKRSPFEQHLLHTHNEHIKNMYITMLLTIASKNEAKQFDGYMIAAKIYYGTTLELPFEQLIRNSNFLTLDDYIEFYEVLQANDLQYAFLIDALMLAGLAGDTETYAYIAEFASCLQLEEAVITEACRLVKAILEVNEQSLRTIFKQSNTFLYVAKPYLLTLKLANYPLLIVKGDGEMAIDLSDYFAEAVILENVKIRNMSGKRISKLKKFSLKNCVLDDDISLQLLDIDKIELTNIKFSSMKLSDEYLNVKPMEIRNAQSVTIRNLSWHSLKVDSNYLLKCTNIQKLTIEQCQFSKILIQPYTEQVISEKSNRSKENIRFGLSSNIAKSVSDIAKSVSNAINSISLYVNNVLIDVKETQQLISNNNTMTECKRLRNDSYYDIPRLMNEGVDDKGDVI